MGLEVSLVKDVGWNLGQAPVGMIQHRSWDSETRAYHLRWRMIVLEKTAFDTLLSFVTDGMSNGGLSNEEVSQNSHYKLDSVRPTKSQFR